MKPVLVNFSQIQRIFTTVYQRGLWGGGSGTGSTLEATAVYRHFLQTKLDEWRPRTIVDIGCGSWSFSKLVDWGDADYLGIDPVEPLIERNRLRYGRDNIRFEVRDIFRDPPSGDLLICKDVLQHWPLGMVYRFVGLLPRFRRGLITNCVAAPDGLESSYPVTNSEIALADYRPLDLRKPPFDLPLALGCEYVTPDRSRERKAVLIWDSASG